MQGSYFLYDGSKIVKKSFITELKKFLDIFLLDSLSSKKYKNYTYQSKAIRLLFSSGIVNETREIFLATN